MTLTIELTPEIRARLDAEAEAQGIDTTELARRMIESNLTQTPSTWGAQVLAEWQREGAIGYRTDITDSQAHAHMLRETAQRRGREWLR